MDETFIEIEEWKQNVPDICVKSCSRVLLRVLETSHQLYLKETILYESQVSLKLIIEFRNFGMRFLNIFKYNLLSYIQQI